MFTGHLASKTLDTRCDAPPSTNRGFEHRRFDHDVNRKSQMYKTVCVGQLDYMFLEGTPAAAPSTRPPTNFHCPIGAHSVRKFSKGGPGKQAELMELMAKAQRDRAKREMEERLRESGDLPPEDESKVDWQGNILGQEFLLGTLVARRIRMV